MKKQDLATGFIDVDRMADPGSFVHYLDTVSAMELFQAYKRRTFALLNVREGHHLLDVGCGTGDDVRVLAQIVGSTGRVVGVDNSETMIAEARKRAEGLNLPVEYRVGDAHNLDFADNTFGGCRADRVFQHLEDPWQALAEMIRVVRPGARIVVVDPDYETLVVDVPDRALTRKILNFYCDSIRNGWIGRRLPGLFKKSGLTDIAVITDTLVLTDYALANQIFEFESTVERAQEAGVVSAAAAANWLDRLEEASQAGRFFLAVTGFGVSGRKP